MSSPVDFDSIGMDHLRDLGSVKWSMFPGTIGAFVAEMDFGTAPVITEALHTAIDRSAFGYLPDALSRAMSEAFAAFSAETYGWHVAASDVHPIADVVRGLEFAMEHFSAPGSKVILPTPAYMPFLEVPRAAGREIIEVPMLEEDGRYTLDLDGIDAAFKDGGGLLILCNPYNPVGRVFSADELRAVSEVVARNGGRVFSDEIHAPMVFAPARHIPYASITPEAAAHTVTATSASKAWNLPGLKCAQFIVSNDADRAIWEVIGPFASHGASNLGVIANTVAYTSGRAWLDEVVGYIDENRRVLGDLLAEHLPQARYHAPEGTYIAWIDMRGLGLGDSPADFFRERAGVSLTDGIACGEPGRGFVRLIFATPRPILETAITQMAAALGERGAG